MVCVRSLECCYFLKEQNLDWKERRSMKIDEEGHQKGQRPLGCPSESIWISIGRFLDASDGNRTRTGENITHIGVFTFLQDDCSFGASWSMASRP